MTETNKVINKKAPTQPKKVELENKRCFYECKCKKCERCIKCDYTVNGLRYFHKVDGKLYCEFCLPTRQNLITLQGFTTSQIQQALKAKNPYPARVFLKVVQECIDCENTKTLCQTLQPKHKTCEECAKQKCQKCEIPVFFRIKETPTYEGFIKSRTGKYINYSKCINTSRGSKCTYEYAEQCGECSDKFKAELKNCENWIRPKIKKGSHIQVQGYFSTGTIYTKQSERKSFTATSYQLLAQATLSQIEQKVKKL